MALATALLAIGCAHPCHAGGRPILNASGLIRSDATVTPAAAATPTATASPAPPGVRMPGKVRAEAFWDRGLRYRFFHKLRVELADGLPRVGFADEALIDGRVGFKLNVDGAAFVARDGFTPEPDRVAVRRAFLMTSGTVHFVLHPVDYNLSFGLLEHRFYIDSGSIALRNLPGVGTLKIGAFDAPLGLDSLTNNRDRIFMEVASPLQAFATGTLPGIQIGRPYAAERGTWALGWFTVGQQRDVGDDSRSPARFVGRTTRLLRDPDAEPVDRGPELLHVGIAASYVFSSSASVRYNARPESYLAPITVDTDTIEARSAFVLGTEIAARRGPLSFQGEYLQAVVDGRSTPTFPGLYVALAYLLTGEVRPYDRAQGVFGQLLPLRPLDLRARAFGAAEVAARYSWVDLDDDAVAGGNMHVLSGGLNWYWNRYVRWQLGYELAIADGGPRDGRLHVFQARFQLVL